MTEHTGPHARAAQPAAPGAPGVSGSRCRGAPAAAPSRGRIGAVAVAASCVAAGCVLLPGSTAPVSGTTLALFGAALFGAVLFGTAGAAAGAVARVGLGRMRRGARVRAPVCEVAVGVLWAGAGAAWLAGAVPGRWVPVLLGLGWLVVAGSVVDVLHHRLPDALTRPAWPAAFLAVVPLGPGALGRAAVGAVVAASVHAAVHLAAPRALGGGDVKLAGPLGAVLAAASWPALALAGMLAAVLSAVLAIALLAAGRTGRAGAVPHGPSMLLATWLVVAGAALGAGAG